MKEILMWTLGFEIKKNEGLALKIIFFSNHWKTRNNPIDGLYLWRKIDLKTRGI